MKYLDGRDLRPLPLIERKAMLEKLLAKRRRRASFNPLAM
jgi:ATP-dependent DNA ligase